MPKSAGIRDTRKTNKEQSMAKRTQKKAEHYAFDKTRTYLPPARIAGHGEPPQEDPTRYALNPHLPPTLRSDPDGVADEAFRLLDLSKERALTEEEIQRLESYLRQHTPWLEWSGKREAQANGHFTVNPLVLQVHERISAEAVIRSATRKRLQRELFAVPELDRGAAVGFYQHEMDWTNRLILGDSLQVMNSLAVRERMKDQIQMIYFDPPYGIGYRSNFMPAVGTKPEGSTDRDEDLTREPEMVKAFRDTWKLGVHSYLEYLRKRLVVAKQLLAPDGSLFFQIGDENVHHVRELLDEIFGKHAFVSQIVFTKTTGLAAKKRMASRVDYLLWYSPSGKPKFRFLYEKAGDPAASGYPYSELPTGEIVKLDVAQNKENGRSFMSDNLTKPGPGAKYDIEFEGRMYGPGNRWWGFPKGSLARLIRADRAIRSKSRPRYKRYWEDFPYKALTNLWLGIGGANSPQYVVQTSEQVIKRCILMTTDPGDIVLDPTCGGGTTALVAERWGRRWITIDTSRVAVSIARHRILTASFPMWQTAESSRDPSVGFEYHSAPKIEPSTVANNTNLDPILDRYDRLLSDSLQKCNEALARVDAGASASLKAKFDSKWKTEGKQSITEDDQRRLILPKSWQHWEVPFNPDPDWPRELQDAVQEYRALWSNRKEEIETTIAEQAEKVDLVDQPKVVTGTVRVSGPFTVEGVLSKELAPHGAEAAESQPAYGSLTTATDNYKYLENLTEYLRRDGVTFAGNTVRQFAWIEPLFDLHTTSTLHAEGAWADDSNDSLVGVGFGPQHGPVTAPLVEDFLRASSRYQELVIAGFSFDPEAISAIRESSSSRLRVHQAHVRPDINPSMEGLLSATAQSQLFSVFGEPEIKLSTRTDGTWVVELVGVDIYEPLRGEVLSTGATKVAAWFLDSDYDGRTFCVTQAFFPNQDSWAGIANALRSAADEAAFAAFSGTESLPFEAGPNERIAVKVIDPRGNEVMTVSRLESKEAT